MDPTPPTPTKDCVDCGPRSVNQFRTRTGGRLNSRCRRCTKWRTRAERRNAAQISAPNPL